MLIGPLVASLVVAQTDCRSAYQSLEYRDAAALCMSAIPESSGAERVELYTLLGLSLAASNEAERATEAFVSLLLLSPTFQLDPTASPKLLAPFEAARTRIDDTRFSIDVEPVSEVLAGEAMRLRIAVDDGPADPIVTVVLETEREQRRLDASALPSVVSLLGPMMPGPFGIDVIAFDRFGGALERERTVLQAVVVEARPWFLTWPVWAGVAGFFIAGGAAAGIYSSVRSADAKNEPFADDADRARSDASGAAIAANIAYAIGGLFAVGTGVLIAIEVAE